MQGMVYQSSDNSESNDDLKNFVKTDENNQSEIMIIQLKDKIKKLTNDLSKCKNNKTESSIPNKLYHGLFHRTSPFNDLMDKLGKLDHEKRTLA